MELGDIIVTIGRILNNLEKIQEERGVPNAQNTLVDNNIKNSSLGKKKESSSLSSSEKKKLSEVFSLFNQAFFAYQKKQTPDEAPKTLISKLEKQTKPKETSPKLPSGGFGGLGIIATIAAAIFALAAWAKDYLGPVGIFLTKLPFKLKGLIKSFEIVKDIFKVFRESKLGKILEDALKPVTKFFEFFKESKISKFFVGVGEKIAEAFNVFKKVGGAVKNVFKGEGFLGKILKGLTTTIGGKIMKALRFIPFIGGIIQLGFAYSFFKEGKPIRATFELISAILDFIPGVGNAASFMLDGALLLYDLYDAKQDKKSQKVDGSKGGGILGTIKEKMGTALSGKLRYLPLIGGLVYLGESYKAFTAGDLKGGLKDLGLGILGTIGGQGLIDGLNWVMSFFDTPEQQQAQINEGGVMGTIKGWVSSIGQYISDNAMNLPIIGGIKRFGMAWDAFTGGNIGEGFKLLGEGVLAFVGGGPLVSGFNMLAGWLLGGEKEDTKSLSPDGSWKDRLKNWIKGKLHKLPAFLRKPLEWFGILDETDKEAGDNATVSAPIPKKENLNSNTEPEKSKLSFSKITDSTTSSLKKVDDTAGSMFLKITDSVGDGLNAVGDIAGGMFSSLKDLGKNAFDTAFKKFSEISPELSKFAGDTVGKLSNTISTMLPDIKPISSTTIPNNKYEKLTENNTTENLQNDSNKYEMPKTYTRNETSQNKNEVQNNEAIGIGQIIERVSSNECKYLEALVNIGNLTLKEMRKTSSSGGEVSVIPQASPATPTSNKNRIPLIDNRIGYANSVYALG